MLGFGLGLNKWRRVGGGFVGLLDLFPNAAAAYSLRLLRKDYSGGLVRARAWDGSANQGEADVMAYRVSATEYVLDLNSTLENLDATAISRGLTTSDTLADLVSTGVNDYDGLTSAWYDQSLSNDATQSTAANQPKIVSAGSLVTENGKAAIDFDGVNDRLITSSFASTLAQPSTTFIVNNAPNNTSNNTLIDGIIVSNRHLLIANVNNYTLNAGTFVNTGVNSDAQSLLYTLWNGASSEFASDGGTPNIINIGTQGLTGLTIGANFVSSNANDGNVQEIILYNSNQSTNRTGIETNINDFYSIF